MESAKLKCPFCGYGQELEIPDNKCLAMYKCIKCGELITPKEECCVICEFSDNKCPAER